MGDGGTSAPTKVRAAGMCSACRCRPADGGKKTCSGCRENAARRYAAKVAAGFCAYCPALVVPGTRFCEACAARWRGRYEEHFAKANADGLCVAPECKNHPAPGRKTCEAHLDAMKAQRRARVRAGQCFGCELAAEPGHRYCAKCIATNASRNATRHAERRARGVCIRCQEPPVAAGMCLACWFKQMATVSLKDRSRADDLRALWDAQGGRCAYTGDELAPGVNASLDHRVPRSRGGADTLENLQWVTLDVNRAKNALPEETFIAMCQRVARHHPA